MSDELKKALDAIANLPPPKRLAQQDAPRDAEAWLLNLMGEWDFTIPTVAFDKIVGAIAPAQDAERERDADLYRYLRSIAQLVEFDGGNSGVWDIRGIRAYENWIGGHPFNHKTFDAAVIAARAQRATAQGDDQ